MDRNASFPPVINATAPTTNPTTSSVLADTGALASGLYEIRVSAGATVAAIFQLQRRNAANGANVGSIIHIRTAAGQTTEQVWKYELLTSERIRLLPQANITGDAEAAIQAERVV